MATHGMKVHATWHQRRRHLATKAKCLGLDLHEREARCPREIMHERE